MGFSPSAFPTLIVESWDVKSPCIPGVPLSGWTLCRFLGCSRLQASVQVALPGILGGTRAGHRARRRGGEENGGLN